MPEHRHSDFCLPECIYITRPESPVLFKENFTFVVIKNPGMK